MKKIYTFTLESDDYPSGRIRDDIRIIAAMVYEEIYNYIGDGVIPLNINKYIVYNQIGYSYRMSCGIDSGNRYVLKSDIYDDGYINYEPFIVGNKTFGMTIVDDSFDIIIVKQIVNYVLNLLKLNYRVLIEEFSYQSKNIDDESCRDFAINKIYNKFSYEGGKRTRLRRFLKNTFSRKNNNISVCGR